MISVELSLFSRTGYSTLIWRTHHSALENFKSLIKVEWDGLSTVLCSIVRHVDTLHSVHALVADTYHPHNASSRHSFLSNHPASPFEALTRTFIYTLPTDASVTQSKQHAAKSVTDLRDGYHRSISRVFDANTHHRCQPMSSTPTHAIEPPQ